MSSFTFLVSDHPLQQVDHSGIVELTVREMKEMYPISETFPEQPWHSMDDDTRILHAPDQSAFGKLAVSISENPPTDLAYYSDKKYIYSIQGNWGSDFLMDFANYMKTSIHIDDHAQLLLFWAGDGIQQLKEHTVAIDKIEPDYLEMLEHERNIRLRLA